MTVAHILKCKSSYNALYVKTKLNNSMVNKQHRRSTRRAYRHALHPNIRMTQT